jgi:hypothetical protein
MRVNLLPILVLIIFSLPLSAIAAELSLSAEPQSVGVGDTVLVTLHLSSAIPLNAVSASLRYSDNMTPISFSNGNSIVSIWLTSPIAKERGTSVDFEGLIPGGYVGEHGVVIRSLFKATRSGPASVVISSARALRNDGIGTEEPLVVKPLALLIGPTSIGGYVYGIDTTPPEPFSPARGNDPSLFGGHAYLVFNTVDKGSGISHYEIAEYRLPFLKHFADAQSPYELKHQSGTYTVVVKAFDNEGNARVEVFPRQRLLSPYEKGLLAIMLIGIALYFVYRRARVYT